MKGNGGEQWSSMFFIWVVFVLDDDFVISVVVLLRVMSIQEAFHMQLSLVASANVRFLLSLWLPVHPSHKTILLGMLINVFLCPTWLRYVSCVSNYPSSFLSLYALKFSAVSYYVWPFHWLYSLNFLITHMLSSWHSQHAELHLCCLMSPLHLWGISSANSNT